MIHTPTPWKCKPGINSDAEYHIYREDGNFLTTDDAEHEANAAFIVRAVNCHDELVDFVKAIAKRGMDAHAGLNFIIECARELAAKVDGETL